MNPLPPPSPTDQVGEPGPPTADRGSTSARWQVPVIDRDDRWFTGVSAGIARELGVDPLMVRVSFVLLTLANGWGLVLYLGAWLGVRLGSRRWPPSGPPQPKAADATQRHVAIAMVVVGLVVLATVAGPGASGRLIVPAGFLLVGLLITWTRLQDEGGISSVARTGAGILIGLAGIIGFLALSADLTDAVLILVVALAVIVGVGVLAAPALTRIGADLDHERQERVRADERARMAAHLHDSVLQTLTLIQRHADQPNRTAQLARRQERELRAWLYRGEQAVEAGTLRLGSVLEAMASDVEGVYDVTVEVVAVGDLVEPVRPAIEDLVAATREAVVNAAKHSGAAKVDVFLERFPDRVEVFVRDTGAGFDPATVPEDRQGINQSIRARMSRAGGGAEIVSAPGAGTEVELSIPLEHDGPDEHEREDP
ncbi:MAG: PspC domain-containing protein [Acidimicrobiales bacterium]